MAGDDDEVLFTGGSVAVEPTEEDRPEIGANGTGVAFSQSADAFEFSISNVKAGFYYTAYVTDDLTKSFVKVVVSSSPKSAGDPE